MFCNGMLLTQLTANMCHLSKSPAIDARDLNPWGAELQGHSFAGYPSRSFGHYTRMKCLYDLYGCCNSGCHCMCGSRQQGDQQLVGAHLLSSPAPIATHPAQIAKHPACIAILCCDETQHLPWTQQIQPEWGGLGRMFSSRLLAPANVREVWSDSNDPLHAWPAVNMQALAKASRIRVCIFAWHQQQAPARSWSFSRTPSSREMRRHIWKQLHIEMHRRTNPTKRSGTGCRYDRSATIITTTNTKGIDTAHWYGVAWHSSTFVMLSRCWLKASWISFLAFSLCAFCSSIFWWISCKFATCSCCALAWLPRSWSSNSEASFNCLCRSSSKKLVSCSAMLGQHSSGWAKHPEPKRLQAAKEASNKQRESTKNTCCAVLWEATVARKVWAHTQIKQVRNTIWWRASPEDWGGWLLLSERWIKLPTNWQFRLRRKLMAMTWRSCCW